MQGFVFLIQGLRSYPHSCFRVPQFSILPKAAFLCPSSRCPQPFLKPGVVFHILMVNQIRFLQSVCVHPAPRAILRPQYCRRLFSLCRLNDRHQDSLFSIHRLPVCQLLGNYRHNLATGHCLRASPGSFIKKRRSFTGSSMMSFSKSSASGPAFSIASLFCILFKFHGGFWSTDECSKRNRLRAHFSRRLSATQKALKGHEPCVHGLLK